jgi:hypothetical protein
LTPPPSLPYRCVDRSLVSTEPVLPEVRDGRTCGHSSCPTCGASGDGYAIFATGRTRHVLFEWQKGVGGPSSRPTGPRFTDRDAHDEAEAKCAGCGSTFWSLAPALIEDARRIHGAA